MTGGAAARSQTDVVMQSIREMVSRGELKPGARLPVEADLATRLGVSRGSLREGVRALAMMGVLDTRQGDGTYVTALDASMLLAPMRFVVDLQPGHHAQEVATVRRVLETEAAARAALRIDDEQLLAAHTVLDGVAGLAADESLDEADRYLEADVAFHRIVAQASGNDVLETLIEALSSRTIRTRLWRAVSEQGAVARTHQQHVEILRALDAHDPDRARTAMAFHLMGVEDFTAAHDEEPDVPAHG
jgi:GntR family transcriptional regulator, transcriptional repressor for pyruvate dehydrogenase complex